MMKLFIVIAAVAAAVSAASAGTVFVTAKVPDGRTVAALTSGTFDQTVTCKKACALRTRVGIKPPVARALGFTGVKKGEPWHWIGTTRNQLKAAQPTKLPVKLTDEARRLLAKAKRNLQVLGELRAVPNAAPLTNFSTVWITTLRP